jgi:uncharacterized membrane protein required for colicin V production
MSVLDIIIVLLLLYALWSGWRKGATRILGGIIVFVAALVLGTLFGNAVGYTLMPSSYLAPIVGFFILFILVMVVGSFFTKKISPRRGIFAGLDKLFGAAFSVVRMVFLIGLVAAFFRLFHVPSASTANRSTLYPVTLHSAASVVTQLKPLAIKLSDDAIDAVKPASNQ